MDLQIVLLAPLHNRPCHSRERFSCTNGFPSDFLLVWILNGEEPDRNEDIYHCIKEQRHEHNRSYPFLLAVIHTVLRVSDLTGTETCEH